jgi:hypothetical protein
MNFTRGGDVKETLGIGRDAILKEIGGIVLNDQGRIERWKTTSRWDEIGLNTDPIEKEENELAENNFKNKNVIIGITDGQFTILRNRTKYSGPDKGDEKDLITVVKPMGGPTGQLIYLDYPKSNVAMGPSKQSPLKPIGKRYNFFGKIKDKYINKTNKNNLI